MKRYWLGYQENPDINKKIPYFKGMGVNGKRQTLTSLFLSLVWEQTCQRQDQFGKEIAISY
jgi:hypothetical protein